MKDPVLASGKYRGCMCVVSPEIARFRTKAEPRFWRSDASATAGGRPLNYQKPRLDKNLQAGLSVDAWAMRGSNPRPRACEARALTS